MDAKCGLCPAPHGFLSNASALAAHRVYLTSCMQGVYTVCMQDVIMGGFFGLELAPGRDCPHPESEYCAYVSSGRAAFASLLQAYPAPLRRVWLPHFTCDTVLEPLARLGLAAARYSCTEQLTPLLPGLYEPGDAVLLTDYFGLTTSAVALATTELQAQSIPVFVDATTAFFTEPLPGVPTFYSPRKFMGVADGGMACAPYALPLPPEQDSSLMRSRVLLERLERGALAALPASEVAENDLHAAPRRMSPLTRTLLRHMDYPAMAEARCRNYRHLHAALADLNHLALPDKPPSAPMCYPFVSAIPGLRDALIDAGIALPLFWPEVLEACEPDSTESRLARRLLPLPLDQRYGEADMERLLRLILG